MDTDTNITKNTTSRPLSSCYVDTKPPSFNKALIIPICGSIELCCLMAYTIWLEYTAQEVLSLKLLQEMKQIES